MKIPVSKKGSKTYFSFRLIHSCKSLPTAFISLIEPILLCLREDLVTKSILKYYKAGLITEVQNNESAGTFENAYLVLNQFVLKLQITVYILRLGTSVVLEYAVLMPTPCLVGLAMISVVKIRSSCG